MKNRIKFYKFVKVASKVLIGILIALAVLVVAALIFRACAPAENNIAYASEADGIGVWLWNDVVNLSPSAEGEFSFNFVSNNENFVKIIIDTDSEIIAYQYADNNRVPVYQHGSIGWEPNINYQTIDIKTAPPAGFMTILRAYATYQGSGTPTTYTVTKQATDCTISGADTIEQNATATYSITANAGYNLPVSVEVTNATQNYNAETGALTISNPTGNVTITATATQAQNVIGYWLWDSTLSDFTNAGMIGRRFAVNITSDNKTYDTISFSGGSSGGTNFDNLFYMRTENGTTTQTEVYASQMQPKWVERYRKFRLNEVPDSRLSNYLQLNAEYLGETLPTFTVTKSISNGTIPGGANTIEQYGTANYQIAPNNGYTFPESIEVANADYTYNANTGAITISNPVGDVTIFVRCRKVEFSLQGTYTFLQFPLLPVDLGDYYIQNVNFTTTNSAGITTEWKYMWWTTTGGSGGPYYEVRYSQAPVGTPEGPNNKIETVYGIRQLPGYPPTQPHYEYTWFGGEYQIVNFGDAPQEVPEAYYNWVTTNAVTGDITQSEDFQKGYEFGKRNGIEEGKKIGLEEAKDIVSPNSASWNAGYNKGLADGADNSLLDGPKAIFGSIVDILNINIFGIPGFTVGAIVAIVVALGVLLFVLKIIRG